MVYRKHAMMNAVRRCLLLSVAVAAMIYPQYYFGTLLSDPSHAAKLYDAGIRVVHLEVGWDSYEKTDGEFDTNYIARVRAKLEAFQRAGMRVVLGTGLQYAPAWVFNYINSRYVNQDGSAASGKRTVNLTFNQMLRERVERYHARFFADFPVTNFWAVRVGSGCYIECLYPSHNDSGTSNSYWGFDENAQGGAMRPPSIPACPFPGWKPGERTYAGKAFTVNDVARWYNWYLGAMVDGINWQIRMYRNAGFSNYIHVLMPGLGSRPSEYTSALEYYLDGSAPGSRTMSRAAVWDRVAAKITERKNIVMYISSVADGSGGDNLPTPEDASVSIDNPVITSWSAVRWISYVADRYGFIRNGENPGRRDTKKYGSAMLERSLEQMHAAHFQGFLWAHESTLFDGTGPSLDEYAALIKKYGNREQ